MKLQVFLLMTLCLSGCCVDGDNNSATPVSASRPEPGDWLTGAEVNKRKHWTTLQSEAGSPMTLVLVCDDGAFIMGFDAKVLLGPHVTRDVTVLGRRRRGLPEPAHNTINGRYLFANGDPRFAGGEPGNFYGRIYGDIPSPRTHVSLDRPDALFLKGEFLNRDGQKWWVSLGGHEATFNLTGARSAIGAVLKACGEGQ